MWFDSHQKIDSNRFNSASLLLSDEKWGRAGTNWCLDTHFSCLCACCCITDSTVTVKYCIQTPSCGRIEPSEFFWKPNRFESIHQVNWIKPIRIANWNALLTTAVIMSITQTLIILCCSSHINSERSQFYAHPCIMYHLTPSNVTSKLTTVPRHNNHNPATPCTSDLISLTLVRCKIFLHYITNNHVTATDKSCILTRTWSSGLSSNSPAIIFCKPHTQYTFQRISIALQPTVRLK